LEVEAERSEVSRSFGVRRRSKELEEAEVRAEVEEDDLSVKVDQTDGALGLNLGCCSTFVEAASRFDVRRTVGTVGWSFSTL
jgi:hypothetical protein